MASRDLSKPREPSRLSSLEELEPQFKEDVLAWIELMAAEKLPITVFETRRSLDRQRYLYGKGVSRAGDEKGPHVWGLAIDVVLDPKDPGWRARGGPPIRVGDAGAPWDTGIELRAVQGLDGKPMAPRCVVVRPHVADVVMRMGALALQVGLEWGGRNEGMWRSRRPGDLFGWDAFHYQRLHWRGLTSKIAKPR